MSPMVAHTLIFVSLAVLPIVLAVLLASYWRRSH